MTTTDWADLADWYDGKQGDEGDFWHRTLLDPALFQLLGEVEGLRVLDVPCGNGHNTRRLAWLGTQVIGTKLSTVPPNALSTRRDEVVVGKTAIIEPTGKAAVLVLVTGAGSFAAFG